MKKLFFILLIPFTIFSQSKYKAVGSPVDPKVKVRWNKYYDSKEVEEILKKIAKAYPEICKLESIGKSHGGKDIWAMTITEFKTGKANEKPAYWVDGGTHANEVQSVEVCLYTIWYIAECQVTPWPVSASSTLE